MTTENLERSFRDARAVVATISPDQFDQPTPCQSWTVRDVLDHMIGGSYHFADAVNNGKAAPPSEGEDFTSGDFLARYDEGIKQAVAAFGAPGALDKTLELHFGPLPAAAFMGIATTDAFVHAWDLARATGQSTDLDPEFAAQLLEGSKMFIQPGFRGPDTERPFGAEQPAPSGSCPADALAAFLGRTL
jgi:uncharacterized protein (TIGR03086 family)